MKNFKGFGWWRVLAPVFLWGIAPALWAASSDMPAGLWAAFNDARHRIEPTNNGNHYAWNPGNRFRVQFDTEAVNIGSGDPKREWHWGLRLTGYGTPDKMQPVQAAQVTAKGSRLEYRRGPVTEWYENKPEGLEQGFTLAAPPRQGADTVALGLAVNGGLQPLLQESGQSIIFNRADGTTALKYSELKAVDANGTMLPARLKLKGGALRIEVQTRRAVWPVVVDPLIQSSQRLAGEATGDHYGYSVAISGTTAVVGAPDHQTFGLLTPCGIVSICYGKVYLFTRSLTANTGDATWTETETFITNTALLGLLLGYDAQFGKSVAVYGDSTILIGAPDFGGTVLSRTNQGRVYVLTKVSGTWGVRAQLDAPDAANNDHFGTTLALTYSSTIPNYVAAIGAPLAANGGTNRGKGYVFTGSGASWSGSSVTPSGLANSDKFGNGVAVVEDTVLVGAPGHSTNGTVYCYTSSGSACATATISAPSGASGFGSAVALYGSTALIGAPISSGGAAYVYDMGSTTTPLATLQATAGSGVTVSQFGSAVSLFQDTALVGAYNSTVSGNAGAGSAYVFSGSGSEWAQQAELTSTSVAASNQFGWAVALSGYNALVGAPGESSATGAAYSLVYPCGFGVAMPADSATQTSLWGMLATPCNVTGDIATAFANVPNYSTRWIIRSYSESTGLTTNLAATDTLTQGRSYWFRGFDPGVLQVASGTGSATAVVKDSNCDTGINPDGCYEVPLVVPTSGGGLMNFVGSNMPFNVNWSDIRVKVVSGATTTVHTSPSAAQTAGVISNTIYVWNGTQAKYDSYNDTTAGALGMLRVFRGFWVQVQPQTAGTTVSLLIPAKTTLKTAAAVPGGVQDPSHQQWYVDWLNWVVPSAKAAPFQDEELANSPPAPKPVPLGGNPIHQRAQIGPKYAQEGLAGGAGNVQAKGWYVRLIVDIPQQRIKDDNNLLGQQPGTKIGYDADDLVELPPFGTPYLTIVFPHPDWGDHKGNYTTDYRPSEGGSAARAWNFEIRSDQPYTDVRLRWQATDPKILKRSRLVDRKTGEVIDVNDYPNGLTLTMPVDKISRYRWYYLGR